MKIVHLRFNTILTTLAAMRDRRDRFQRLLRDRPTGIRVSIREKSRDCDLKAAYPTVIARSCALTAALLIVGAIGLPALQFDSADIRKDQIVIQMEDIPETRQIVRPPPPPRPAVPIEVENNEVPDDVTIESTELDFDDVDVNLPPPPPPGSGDVPPAEEEIIEFWKVEVQPEPVKQVPPVYPDVALRAGLEGTVICRILVGKKGEVIRVEVLKGDDVFVDAALTAARQYVFTPAMQNDRPVQVWMVIPMHFRLAR